MFFSKFYLILSKEDEKVREVIMNAWTNFAKYGDPGMSWTPSVLNSNNQYWNISGPSPSMQGRQEIRDRMSIWDEVCLNNKKC